jgi:Ca-activated chloride channel homolog
MSPVRIRTSHVAAALCALVAVAGVSCFKILGARFPAGNPSIGNGRTDSSNDANPKGIIAGITPGSVLPASANSAINESYAQIVENDFVPVASHPLSTFSADVDTASYSNVRRYLNKGQWPPADAVRIADMINYFTYDYPEPTGEHPVAIAPELNPCPWNPDNYLLRIGVQARHLNPKEMPPRNFVFLIDVSGSMADDNRLPLVKKSLELLVEQLREQDRVAIVTYAGECGVALGATPGNKQAEIRKALKKLKAEGCTNGGDGIQRAYKIAQENFKKGGINRVILATDGDFNVGVTDEKDLVKLIEEKRKSGVYLTVLGYGMGNLKDSTLEKLAHHGNGHYAYIDSEREARKLFVEQGAALAVVAKDVKFQVEFNPQHIESYRLIGYENRLLKDKDFNNDKKDAGDMGSGHTCTALYELVPAGNVKLKYQGLYKVLPSQALIGGVILPSPEWLTIKLRYKDPDAETSKLMEVPVTRLTTYNALAQFASDAESQISKSVNGSPDFRFATAVAAFGMLLRDSPHHNELTLKQVEEWAEEANASKMGLTVKNGIVVGGQFHSHSTPDSMRHRNELVELVCKAMRLKSGGSARAQRE